MGLPRTMGLGRFFAGSSVLDMLSLRYFPGFLKEMSKRQLDTESEVQDKI